MEETRYSQVRKITLLGGAKNIFLAVIKIIFGITGHSHALFADGIHSLSDLIIDGLVLIASRFGSKAADSDHPYGHGRIETAATVLLAIILSMAGIGIIIDAGMEVFGLRTPVKPNLYVIGIALLSVVINEVLYYATRRVGQRIQSNLLLTNAAHHRSDSATSLIVVIGVAGAWLGFERLDAIAAVLVGCMIIKMAVQFGWHSIRELVDTGLDEQILTTIKNCINSVPGVCELHQLRTRLLAGNIFLDVHIIVDPKLSVSEGHYIGQQVHVRLLKDIPNIADVIVHIDPEDDEINAPSRELPSRQEIVTELQKRWHALIPSESFDTITLHYLAGAISLELRLPLSAFDSLGQAEQLTSKLRNAISDMPVIVSIQILFH